MNRKLIAFLFVFFGFASSAQQTEYYKLLRIQKDNKSYKDVTGGQFLTFFNNVCFESDSKGDGVGHGYLTYKKSGSNSEFSTYQGSSYWGSSTTFKFNADKSVLNVVLDNGDIYVYKRATPPAGKTTCSLIRKRDGNTSSSDMGGYNPTYTPQPSQKVTPHPSTNSAARYEKRTYPCTLCHGKGTVPDCDGSIPNFGGQKYCSECGKNVPMCHIHKRCPSCDGKGTYIKMERVN